MTNSGQAVTASLTLSAFGQTVTSSGSSTSAYQFGATSGYRSDGDAGLTLVGCRFYDAQVGQFITRDTYLDQAPYAYCDGDPVNRLDPSGHSWKGWGAGLVVGVIVGVLLRAAVDIVTGGAAAPLDPIILEGSIGAISGGAGGLTTGLIDGNPVQSGLEGLAGGAILGPIGGTTLGPIGRKIVPIVAKFFCHAE